MGRETEAHYLHQRIGLELALKPPVESPVAAAWADNGQLLTGTRGGDLVLVDTALGTRTVAGIGERIARIARGNGWFVIGVAGAWVWLDEGFQELASGRLDLGLVVDAQAKDGVALVNGELDRRRYTFLVDRKGREKSVKVPHGALGYFSSGGGFQVARATERGLEVVRPGSGQRFKQVRVGKQVLRAAGRRLVGFTQGATCVWSVKDDAPASMPVHLPTCASLHPEGAVVAVGTALGGIALANLNNFQSRMQPYVVKAYSRPVTEIAFSPSGSWLATIGENLLIWSWEL